jgi:hypothetical protein
MSECPDMETIETIDDLLQKKKSLEEWREGVLKSFPDQELIAFFQSDYHLERDVMHALCENVRKLKQRCYNSWPKTLVNFELFDELMQAEKSKQALEIFERIRTQLKVEPQEQKNVSDCMQIAHADFCAMLQQSDHPLSIELLLKSRELSSENAYHRIVDDLSLTLLKYRVAFQPELIRFLHQNDFDEEAENLEALHFYQLKALMQLLDQLEIGHKKMHSDALKKHLRKLHTLSAVPDIEAKIVCDEIDAVQREVSTELGELSGYFDLCYDLSKTPSFRLLKSLQELEIDSDELDQYMKRSLQQQALFSQNLQENKSIHFGKIFVSEKELSKNELKLIDRVTGYLEKEAARKKFRFAKNYDTFIVDCIELFSVLQRNRH